MLRTTRIRTTRLPRLGRFGAISGDPTVYILANQAQNLWHREIEERLSDLSLRKFRYYQGYALMGAIDDEAPDLIIVSTNIESARATSTILLDMRLEPRQILAVIDCKVQEQYVHPDGVDIIAPREIEHAVLQKLAHLL